MEPNYHRITEC